MATAPCTKKTERLLLEGKKEKKHVIANEAFYQLNYDPKCQQSNVLFFQFRNPAVVSRAPLG
jgi:hypothetical protein